MRGTYSALNGRYVLGGFVSGRAFSIAADSSVQTQRAAHCRRHRTDRAAGRGQGGAIGNVPSFAEGAAGGRCAEASTPAAGADLRLALLLLIHRTTACTPSPCAVQP